MDRISPERGSDRTLTLFEETRFESTTGAALLLG